MDEQPTVGAWYETDEGEAFTVLAMDRSSGVLDVQYLDGRVDQLELSAWATMELLEVEPPENWQPSPDEQFTERGRKK
jgi:hypothetical protein